MTETARFPDELRYVYAVGRSGTGLEAAAERVGGAGVAGAGVRVVCAGGLGALVADVPASGFDADGIRAQLDDLDRLEAIARAHHAVVEGAYQATNVLPMRLATVYVDDQRVAGMLTERAAEFEELLGRLDGHLEWGVKVYADSTAAPAAPPAPAPADEAPGRAYLRQRRAQRDGARSALRAAEELASRVLREAGDLASARVAHRPQHGALAGDKGENVANYAFLVPVEQGERFPLAVRELAGRTPGARVEVTGPWAPYSFAQPATREAVDER